MTFFHGTLVFEHEEMFDLSVLEESSVAKKKLVCIDGAFLQKSIMLTDFATKINILLDLSKPRPQG